MRLQQSGRGAEAISRLQAFLHVQPGDADAWQFLGVLLSQQGKLDSALTALRHAIRLNPRSPEAQNNLGMVLQAANRQEEAAAEFGRALALRPGYAVALNNLGNALCALDRWPEAIERYRAALAIEPHYAAAANNLGTALMHEGRPRDALPWFRAALAARSDFTEARANLGLALAAANRHAAAANQFRRALAAQPGNADTEMALGRALQAQNKHAEALLHLRAAVRLQPQRADAHATLGLALQEAGLPDEAEHSLLTACELAPRGAAFHLNLASSRTMRPGDALLDRMLALAAEAEALPPDEQAALHFALGKALTDIGEPASGFDHLLRGNAIRRALLRYDEAAVLGRIARTRQVFSAALIDARLDAGNPSEQPVFIVGMPRSGSTLVEQVLAAHGQVCAAGELMALRETLRGDETGASRVDFPDEVPALGEQRLRGLAASYLAQLQDYAGDGAKDQAPPRITDKMPANFRYAGLIRMMLPNARIIHTRRDPIDTCLSCFATPFERQPFAFDLAELGRYHRAHDDLMRHWSAILPATALLDVQYEALVTDFETEARRIVAFCGLPWDDACLRFQEARRPVRTASVAQVRRPLYTTSIGRWRPGEDVLRPLFDALGQNDEIDTSCLT